MMKPRTIIGIIFIVASLLKLATLWGIIHWSWFETLSEGPWAMYLCIFVLLYVGVHLKRIRCSVHYGGDEYVYHGETFHGAQLDAFCGGIRLDLREATIKEDEEIDIHTFFGGIELFVPTTVNVEVKSQNFIGGVSNHAKGKVNSTAPTLHIIASNFLGGVDIKN